LVKLALKNKDKKIIVFLNTCHEVSFYHKLIGRWVGDRCQLYGKINVQKITGNMDQSKRLNNLNSFNQGESGIMFATDVIARGIDFDHVDLIIQVDVPQDPSFYIHRIGRTARKGLDGHAILLLNKNEEDYIDYMGEKQIPLEEFSDASVTKFKAAELNQFATKARKMMLQDKDFIIKGSRAYVSFVRSYDEHKVSSIFKTQDLDFEEIARSFFLFKVPFIKELKGKNQSTVIATEEELKQLEAVEFTNKNQAQMIAKKIEQDKEKSKRVFL
jgi:ATP-dependent RNA helicase DDX55/SPB4